MQKGVLPVKTSQVKVSEEEITNGVYALVSSDAQDGGKLRVLHRDSGKSKLDRWGAEKTDGTLMPLDDGSGARLWEVEKKDNGYTVKSKASDGHYIHLDNTSATAKAGEQVLVIAKVADGGGYSIGCEVDGKMKYLTHTKSGWTVGDEPYAIFLYREMKETVTPVPRGKTTTGTTQGQPFEHGTGGSENFRIPALITAKGKNGSADALFAAIDARWNVNIDAGGLDTIVSRSEDGGKTWQYSYANYFNDSTDAYNNKATAFIDPVCIQGNDGTIHMMVDLWPGGVALNSAANNHPVNSSGYVKIDDKQRLVLYASPNPDEQRKVNADKGQGYTHYVGDFSKDDSAANAGELAPVYAAEQQNGKVPPAYYVDRDYYLYDADKEPMYCQQLGSSEWVQQNVFFYNADLHVTATSYLWHTTSTDGGKTWSKGNMLNEQVRAGRQSNDCFYGVGPGRGLVIKTGNKAGRIILPCYTFKYGGGDGNTSVIYSDDQGKTWHRSNDLSRQTSEATVVEADGRLYLFARHAVLAVSDDNGETWKDEKDIKQGDGPDICNRCQLSAITYSKKIDGKTAILLSAPAAPNKNDRDDGKIFVGLVQEDKSIEWKYEYAVTEIGDHYGYSCITEKPDGSIGVLYEGQLDNTAMDEMIYRDIAIEDIAQGALIGNKRALTVPLYGTLEHKVDAATFSGYDEVDSSVVGIEVKSGGNGTSTVTFTGKKEGTASFTELGTKHEYELNVVPAQLIECELAPQESKEFVVPENTFAHQPDAKIATAKISSRTYSEMLGEASGSLGLNAAFDGKAIGLSKALYTFTKNGGTWTIQGADEDGKPVYLKLGASGIPGMDRAGKIQLKQGHGSDTVEFYDMEAQRYLYFWRDAQLKFDRNSTDSKTTQEHEAVSFELYRPVEANRNAASEIPGFERVKGKDAISSGEKLLIVARVKGADGKSDALYAMNPSLSGSRPYAHVLKVDPERTCNVLSVTGVAGGTTDAAVGDVVVRATVSGDPADPSTPDAPKPSPTFARDFPGAVINTTDPCASYMFDGGATAAGSFADIAGARSYVYHFEEHVRWELPTTQGQGLTLQRYVYNVGKKGQSLSDSLESFDARVAALDPKCVVYGIGAEDYSKGEEGLDKFKEDLKKYALKVASLRENSGLLVVQTPPVNPAASDEDKRNVDLYANAAREVLYGMETTEAADSKLAQLTSLSDGTVTGVISSGSRYLKLDGDTLSVTDNAQDATTFTVKKSKMFGNKIAYTVEHDGKCLSFDAEGKAPNFKAGALWFYNEGNGSFYVNSDKKTYYLSLGKDGVVCTTKKEEGAAASLWVQDAADARVQIADHQASAAWTGEGLFNADGSVSQQGHLLMARELAAAITKKDASAILTEQCVDKNFPHLTQVPAPAAYASDAPQIVASDTALEVTIPDVYEQTAWDVELVVDGYTLSTTIDTADTKTFTLSELPKGSKYTLTIDAKDKSVRLPIMEGTVAKDGKARVRAKAAESDNQRAIAELLKGEKSLTWHFVGDSITHGAQHTKGYDSITQLFEKYLRDDLGRTDDMVINTAVSGARTDDTLENREVRIDRFDNVDVTFIMLGTNDAGKVTEADYKKNLKELIEAAKNNGSRVVLRTPIPDKGNGHATTTRGEYAQYMREVVDEYEDVILIDQYELFSGINANAPYLSGLIYGDNIHPSGPGQQIMFRALLDGIGLSGDASRVFNLAYESGTKTQDSDIAPALTKREGTISLDISSLEKQFGQTFNEVSVKAVRKDAGQGSSPVYSATKTSVPTGKMADVISLKNLPADASYKVSVTAHLKNSDVVVVFETTEPRDLVRNLTMKPGDVHAEEVTGDFSGLKIEGLDEKVAKVTLKKVEGSAQTAVPTLGASLGDLGTQKREGVVISDGEHFLAIEEGELASTVDLSNAARWTVTPKTLGGGRTAYLIESGGQDLTFDTGNGAPKLTANGQWFYTDADALNVLSSGASYYLRYLDGRWVASSSKDAASAARLFEVSEPQMPMPKTKVSVEAVAPGETSFDLGDMTWKIRVVDQPEQPDIPETPMVPLEPASPITPETPKQPDRHKATKTAGLPRTGDTSIIAALMTGVGGSLTALFGVVRRRSRK